MIQPAPGWCVVTIPSQADSYAGSSLAIPETAKRSVAKHQVEISALPTTGDRCSDPDCDRPHIETPTDCWHIVPGSLRTGDWCVVGPRSLMPIPDEPERFLCRIDDIRAILRDSDF